jgi:hypothetical protein
VRNVIDGLWRCGAAVLPRGNPSFDILSVPGYSSSESLQGNHGFNVSARAFHRILRVSGTIADLEGARTIPLAHMAEWLGCRPKGLS